VSAEALMARVPALHDHVVTIEIRVPRERVWEEITSLGRVQGFMMNTLLESTLAPGARLRYYSPDKRRVFVVGKVVEVDPPRRFSHTYMFTFRPEEPSLVTWELEDIPGGCRVTLTHGGWTNQAETHKGVLGGWRKIVAALKTQLETGDLPLGTRLVQSVQGAFMFLLPRSTRVEEVARSGW
jgi:uncharacterized protein YndB with AHSA1/START domain